MSGGSYNYLCFKDADDIQQASDSLNQMCDRLSRLPYAEDVAKETMWVILEMRAHRVRVQAAIDRLSGVWKAVEWWDSCDSSESELVSAIAKFRGCEIGDMPLVDEEVKAKAIERKRQLKEAGYDD